MLRNLVITVLLTGCGAPPPSDIGDFCLDLAPIACDASEECDGITSSTCIDDFVALCCGDAGECSTPARDISRSDYNSCLNDLEDRTCAQWSTTTSLPASCQTL